MSAKAQSQGITEVTDDEVELIRKVFEMPPSVWFALSRWSKETGNFEGWQRSIIFSVGTMIGRGKKPTYKQAAQALNVYDLAKRKGFSE